jgi:deoxyadenosine/deoxycytidine kinase
MKQNFHIGIMGNLFSGKTTLMHALARDPYKRDLEVLLDGADVHAFSERVDKGSLIDECLALFYRDRVANIFPTELAFLHMRTMQQREIRHLMTRESPRGVVIIEDRPFIDGPEVFVARMIASGEMPPAHAKLYRTLFHQTLRAEHILREIHQSYEAIAADWRRTLLRYQEHAIVPPDADLLTLPAEIDMLEHPDYVHVAAGTIREKVRRMVASRQRAA